MHGRDGDKKCDPLLVDHAQSDLEGLCATIDGPSSDGSSVDGMDLQQMLQRLSGDVEVVHFQ